jgi:hypothetical protein
MDSPQEPEVEQRAALKRDVVRLVEKFIEQEGPIVDKLIAAWTSHRESARQAAIRLEEDKAKANARRGTHALWLVAILSAFTGGLIALAFHFERPELAQQVVTAFFALFAGFGAARRIQ